MVTQPSVEVTESCDIVYNNTFFYSKLLACFINSLVEAAEEDIPCVCVVLELFITCSDTLT